jgi:hypothetical protein
MQAAAVMSNKEEATLDYEGSALAPELSVQPRMVGPANALSGRSPTLLFNILLLLM